MKRFILVLLFMFIIGNFAVIGQTLTDKLGAGFNLGGQMIFGDGGYDAGIGIGLESYLKYKLSDKIFLKTALGYGELSDGTFHLDNANFTTNMITFDVKGAYNFMPYKTAQPYVFMGLGVFSFRYDQFDQRYFDASLIIGGGLEYMISPTVGINAYADYRYTTGDDLDGMRNNKDLLNIFANDGYLNVRGGFTYYFSSQPGDAGPKVIAENVPLDEIEGIEGEEFDDMAEGIDGFEEDSENNFNMAEYAKLKSKVDVLNDAIRQKELEIEELKAQLDSRKEKVVDLEQRMRNKGGALAASLNMDVSDFSTSYEQGLENFYARDYDAAIYVFNMLVESYPDNHLAGNCRYWIGECYFAQKNYDSAIETFNMVFNYENSVKNDDALLMMGRCYAKMGNGQMAREMFGRLMDEYPDSEYFGKAEKYANEM